MIVLCRSCGKPAPASRAWDHTPKCFACKPDAVPQEAIDAILGKPVKPCGRCGRTSCSGHAPN